MNNKFFLLIIYISFLVINLLNADSSLTVPTPFVNSVNVITGQLVDLVSENMEYDYYQVGKNQLGEVFVSLTKGDFRIGRVKSQKNLSSKETVYFFYASDATELIDAKQHKIIYRYKSNLIQAVEHYDYQSNRKESLYRKERIFWSSYYYPPLLTGRVLEDGQGQALICYNFIYNDQGQLIKETLAGNLSGACSSPLIIKSDGFPELNGVETYSTVYRYSPEDPTLLLNQREDNGMMTAYQYHPKTKQCLAKLTGKANQLLSRAFYRYDEQGLLNRTIVDDGQGETENDLIGLTNRQIFIIQSCQEGPAYGQPLLTENRYLDLKTGKEVLLEKTIYTYCPKGALIQQDFYDANENLRYYLHMNYDEKGHLLSTVDSRGEVALSKQENSQNKSNASDPLTTSLDSYGNETEYTHDIFGRLIETRFPSVLDENDTLIRPTLMQTYNICDQIVSMQDAKGRVIKTSYNIRGKPIEVIYPDGTRETFRYFLDGELKEKVASNGVRSIWEREELGRIKYIQERSHAGKLLQELFYSYEGKQLSSITDNRSFTIYLIYDGAGRQISSIHKTESGIKRLEWVYDACGQKVETKEWFGPGEQDFITKREEKDSWQQTVATYLEDSQGSLQQRLEHTPDSSKDVIFTQILTVSNALGQYVKCQETVDAKGIKELKTYDTMQRLESCVKLNPLGAKISEQQIRYTADGQKVLERHLVFSKGQVLRTYIIKWSYDEGNRLTSIQEAAGSPQQKITHYQYNEWGQLIAIIKPDCTSLAYTYNDKNLVSTFTSSDRSFAYQYIYDDYQRLIGINELIHDIHQTRHYNAFNELIEENLGSPINTLCNQYDSSGRRIRLTLPDQSHILYHYKGVLLNSIERLSKQEAYQHQYTYHSNGHLLTSYLIKDSGIITYQYDKQGHLLSTTSPWWSEKIATDGFDPHSRILSLSVEDPKGITDSNYVYGDDNQLTKEEGNFNKEYEYDSLYNRLAENGQAWNVNELNQLVETPHFLLNYDRNGNLIEKQEGKEKTLYEYDALNRLTCVIKDQETSIQYIYDAFDRRVQQNQSLWNPKTSQWTNIKTEHFLYDGQKEIGKLDASGKMIELRVLGTGKGAEISAAIALELEGHTYIPIHDHQGSVRCLIDSLNGKVAEFYRYSAFGQEEIFDNEGQLVKFSLISNPWRFSSKRLDETTGLILFGKRYYSPQMGRWISPDPLFFYDTPNLYAFVRNDSVNCYDLYGLFSISDIWNTAVSYFFEGFRYLQTSAHNFKVMLSSELKMPEPLGTAFERIGKQLFGNTTYFLMGHAYERTEVGCYGQKDISDKVRVTFINGILTTRQDMLDNLNVISRSHGGAKIYYIFRPTEGWTWDFTRAMMIKMAFHLGFRSLHAYLLAAQWRVLIQEMGGTEGGGTIIHYAHSLGGSETDRARELMSPEEQKMIRVVTFGSPTLISDRGYQKVTNMIGVRDGVSLVLEAFELIGNILDPKTHLKFCGDFFAWPLFDHELAGPTYRPIVEQMGEAFIKEFAPP